MAARQDSERTPKKARARPKREDWRIRFLRALEEHVTVSAACRAERLTRSNVYAERERSSKFAKAWDEIEQVTTERMEAEAFRRAVDGWTERGIYDDAGERIGEVHKFSDTLLMFMLKARRPDTYRESHRVEVTGVQGAPPLEVKVSDREASDATREFLARVAGS